MENVNRKRVMRLFFYSAIIISGGHLRLPFWFGWRSSKIHSTRYLGLKNMTQDYTEKEMAI